MFLYLLINRLLSVLPLAVSTFATLRHTVANTLKILLLGAGAVTVGIIAVKVVTGDDNGADSGAMIIRYGKWLVAILVGFILIAVIDGA